MTQDKPRVARSLKEEAHEILTVLELKDAPREEKMAAEKDIYRGAGEAELEEKSFHRRRHESLDEVRNMVDAMGPRESEPARPIEAPPPPARVVAPEPEPAPPMERPGRLARPVTDHERALIARLLPGDLIDVTIVYESQTGRVVEARYEMGDGKRGASLFALREGQVRDLTDIEAHADALRPRSALVPAEMTREEPRAPPMLESRDGSAPGREAPQESPAEEKLPPLSQPEPEKKGRFGLKGKKEKRVDPTTEAPAAPTGEKKGLFTFGRSAKKEEATPQPPESTSPADATVSAEGKKKFGLPFRKKGP